MIGTTSSYMEELLRTHHYNGQTLRTAVLEDGPLAVGPLLAALPNERGPLLAITIRLLSELGDRRAVVPLIEVLLKEDWPFRPPATFWDHVLYWLFPSVRRLMKDNAELERVFARKSAARALAQLGDPRAIGALLAIRNDPDESVRTVVSEALQRLEVLHAADGAAQPSLHTTP